MASQPTVIMVVPPSATHQYEATVINAPLERLWDLIKTFKFELLNAPRIASTEFVEGAVGQVGASFKVVFNDGPVWVYRVLEISDIYNRVIFELQAAEPALSYHSVLHTIRLYRDSIQSKTFLIWETDFSNDAGLDVIQDHKYKKQESLANTNHYFAEH